MILIECCSEHREAHMSYRSRIRGMLASMAPTILHSHIESHHGNGCFVTWARIIRET